MHVELLQAPEHFVVTLVTKKENHNRAAAQALSYLVNRKQQLGSYVAVQKSFADVMRLAASIGVDSRRLAVLGMNAEKAEGKNHVALGHPSRLAGLEEALEGLRKDALHQFVVVDALHDLAAHNRPEKLARFLHRFSDGVRRNEWRAVLLADRGMDRDTLATAGQFSDRMMHF